MNTAVLQYNLTELLAWLLFYFVLLTALLIHVIFCLRAVRDASMCRLVCRVEISTVLECTYLYCIHITTLEDSSIRYDEINKQSDE